MAKDDIVIIGNVPSRLERRTSSTGRARYTISIESEPLVHDFSPKNLGAPVAMSIAEALRQKVKAIAVPASMRTVQARRDYAKGLAKGNPSALKRYAGGRIGQKDPTGSTMLFNDSSRFADSLVANASSDGAWRIDTAANRLDERTAGGMVAVRRIWNRLVSLVPEFGNPQLLMNDRTVQEGIKKSLELMVQKAEKTREQLTEAKARAMMQLAQQVMGYLAGL